MGENIVEEVRFRGQRKVPQDTLRGLIFTKKGDVYDEEAVHRDFMSLWNSGRFDDLRVEKEKGPNGGVVLTFRCHRTPHRPYHRLHRQQVHQ